MQVYPSRMATLTIDLSSQKKQTAFNLRRWEQLRTDPLIAQELSKFEGRVETNRHGHIIMYPPSDFSHGGYQAEIGCLLRTLLPKGKVATKSPISTADGIKYADVVWVTRARAAAAIQKDCLTKAPEICVEVLSPDNSRREMAEKKALYFAAGAKEVWFCDRDGVMAFFIGAASRGQNTSKFCPEFPRQVQF